MPCVSLAAVAAYDLNLLRQAVRRHFSALGVGEELGPGKRVVLKPNLLMKRRPEEVTTTHPLWVEAVALELQALGVTDITLVDSPGGPYTHALLQGIYQASGMAGVAERTGIKLNTDLTFQHRAFLEGETCKEFNILTPLCQADCIINLPKLKTHGMTTLSGAVKNLFGAVPGLQKPELHFRFPNTEDFSNMLIDLSLLLAPQLTLVDAVVAMEGDGPSGGEPKPVGLTLGSRDLYALDLVHCSLMGLAPKEVPMVAHSIRRGLCPEVPSSLELAGDPLPGSFNFRLPRSRNIDFLSHVPAFLRGPLGVVRDKFLTPKPVIRKKDCIGCGRCAESCPPKTIQIVDKQAIIGYDRCIRCYCCHEMCPVRAIDIRRARFFDL